MVEIGKKIKQYRLKLDLTQEELAQRTELTKGYISQLENDLCSPSIATLEDILHILGVSLQEFFPSLPTNRLFSQATTTSFPKTAAAQTHGLFPTRR